MSMINKMMIASIICVAVLCFFISTLIHITFSNIKKEKALYEQHIGETYILDKDTLTIVNYSTIQEVFILSNGVTVAYNLISNPKHNENILRHNN